MLFLFIDKKKYKSKVKSKFLNQKGEVIQINLPKLVERALIIFIIVSIFKMNIVKKNY